MSEFGTGGTFFWAFVPWSELPKPIRAKQKAGATSIPNKADQGKKAHRRQQQIAA